MVVTVLPTVQYLKIYGGNSFSIFCCLLIDLDQLLVRPTHHVAYFVFIHIGFLHEFHKLVLGLNSLLLHQLLYSSIGYDLLPARAVDS